MAHIRAPKQWALTKQETITTFEAWQQNLQYTLSLDTNFANFLVDGVTWGRKTNADPLRGFLDDGEDIAEARRRTAAQKVTQLELMLGQIANYCPVISRNTIVKNSTSVTNIWQSVRAHFGFQISGAHCLDLNNIKLESGERPEDLFQRLTSFVEDNLLKADGNVQHHGAAPDVDEELTPSLENVIVLTWLRLLNKDLPSLVKQRYGTELRSRTLASLKPEISQALSSLLEEIHTSDEVKIMRTFKTSSDIRPSYTSKQRNQPKRSSPTCSLCKQAGRPRYQHYLSTCKYLSEEDKQYFSKVRKTVNQDDVYDQDQYSDDDPDTDHSEDEQCIKLHRVMSSRRISTKQSPYMKVFHRHHPLHVTLDTGAEVSMVKHATAKFIGASIVKSNQTALQADGVTPLSIVGETRLLLCRGNFEFHLEALVVEDLDVDILAGIPFMTTNDISVRPAMQQIIIGGSDIAYYGSSHPNSANNKVRRTQAFVLRNTTPSTVVWPGSYVELDVPSEIDPDGTLAIESRRDTNKATTDWPRPQLIEAISGKLRILNDTQEPQSLRKHEHFCQIRHTTTHNRDQSTADIECSNVKCTTPNEQSYTYTIHLDPDNILHTSTRSEFQSLLQKYDNVFDPRVVGYNGAVGPFEAHVNMGPVQPPQRKGRVPQYARNKLVELQQKCDDLESQGVLRRPEDIDINVEYINPSFLVKKPKGGYRLVTAFADVGRYSKPQPSLMPDVDSTLRTIAQWKYVIVSDLTSAFYQIPLSKSSMKYCGIAIPSETALEELMCRVLGDSLQDGTVAKLADDLYCGGNTPEEILSNWERVLQALQRCDLRLSASKTVICPNKTTILGWIWSQGTLSASPHRISVLSTCPLPETVCDLRSYIGAYKALSRVLPYCSQVISPLDDACAGRQSQEKLEWTDALVQRFRKAQTALESHKSILLPQPSDQLWIVTDGSVSKSGIGATLYVSRNNKLSLAGFFSAKLRKHQVTWLPCEIEALYIAAAVKHFNPFIIQSFHQTCVLTDSKPCVQAIERLCRGEFSASPRVISFLSTVSRYQVNLRHLAGSVNVPSECNEPRCQLCVFILQTEESVVRIVQVHDIIENMTRMPFTTRSTWRDIQSECPDLRRAHAHLKQGTRPSKKLTNIKDVKRYINVATIAKDNLLVVHRNDPLSPSKELIIVPRSVLDGLVTALHIKLNHPPKHQLQLVMKRHFYALDITKSIDRVCETCHICASLKRFPETLVKQTSDDPPEGIGMSFAADVLKRERQLILVLRETVTSLTTACIIDNEKHETLRDALALLSVELHPLDGPPAVIRVDPAPGFIALNNDETLKQLGICINIGRVKNPNKNPVAEKAISELEDELLRQEPRGGQVSQLSLAVAIARLNSRIRNQGLSARELWTQRSQFTHNQLPLNDRETILSQHDSRNKNHPYSEVAKHKTDKIRNPHTISVGDLVYIYSDRNKSQARSRYLVVSTDGEWCLVKRFTGNQLRVTSYKVKLNECYRVPDYTATSSLPKVYNSVESDDECKYTTVSKPPPPPVEIPPTLTLPAVDVDHNITPELEEPLLSVTDIPPQIPPDNVGVEPEHTRPQRNRRQPKYMEDYIT